MKRTLKIVLIILFVLTVFIYWCVFSGKNKSIKVKFFVKKGFSEPIIGSRIIFSEHNSLFTGDLKGKVLKIASFFGNGCEVGVDSISNDGRWVICEVSLGDSNSSNSVSYVYALDLANLNYFKVTAYPECESLRGSFIYSSHKFLYATKGVNTPFDFIAVCDLDKKTNRFLLTCGDGGCCAFFYNLSENGKYLVYVGGKDEIFPYSATSLRLKNVEIGEEKVLAKCSGGQYIADPIFIEDSRILYSVNGSNGCTYFITDFNGNIEPVNKEELNKFNPVCAVENRLKKKMRKNLHVEFILKECSKVVFTVFVGSGKEKLRISSLDGSKTKTLETGNLGAVFKGINTCKFTYVDPSTGGWYLIDPETFRMTNLSKLYGINEINTAMVLDSN